MKQTKQFKRTALPLSAKSMVSTLLLLIAMLLPQGVWATDFISEVKISVHKDNGETARNKLTNDGYQIVNVDGAADLNGGGGGHYVYIGYKTTTNAAEAITGLLIVESNGFDAHAIDNITNANVTYNGKNYYRCANYDAGDARLDCDLNRGRGSGTADIVLYYTTDGNTSNGGTPLTSISVVGNTTTTGVVYTRHWKYDTAQNGTGNTDVYGNTNQGGNGTAHYIAYTTHTHALTDADYDTNNHKYWCESCGFVKAYNAHDWKNTGAWISDATCENATKYYQTCQYCKRTGDDNHTYYSGSTLGHSYNADGVCTRDASHYQPATLSAGYYQITNYGNLCWFRNEANSGKTINAKLTTDINLSGKSWATSIGEGKEFAGTFDGQGHTITGNARKALFFVLKAGSTVKNVVSSGATSKDNYENSNYQSPFVRRNYGTIENCIVKSAYWDSRSSYLGGITGVNETGGIVRNCGFYDSSLRLRNGADTQMGGIVGVNCEKGRIENCFTWGISYMNIGSLGSGGIVCENRSNAIVSNCYTNAATPVFKQEGTATNLTSGIIATFITSGEMCYKLNAGTTNGSQVWYQKIGTETFPTPVVKNTANTVYKLEHLKCDGKTPNGNVSYTNSSTVQPPVDAHSLTAIPAKAETCTEAGNNAYWRCSTCNKVFSNSAATTETTVAAQTIKATGHGKTNGYTASYDWSGSAAVPICQFTLTCNDCKDSNGNPTVIVNGQSITTTKVQANHVDATCTTDGNETWTATGSYSKTGDATYNGTAQVKDYVIPAVHTFDDVTDPHHTLCTVCDHSFFRYTSLTEDVVNPNNADELKGANGAKLEFTNTYVDGQGVMEFKGTLKTIGLAAFSGCTGFTGNLTIPNSVSSIEISAFQGCSGFNGNLTIPNSVTSIGVSAFSGCTGFTGNLTIPNSVTSIGANAFLRCSSFKGNLTIPNSVTSIGQAAFYECSGFTGNLTIPSSITSIGANAFDGCSGFNGNLTIPNSVTSIGVSAFLRCSSFKGNLTIPNSVTSIGGLAFEGCSGFTGNLTIPNSVTSIGARAFYGCTGFTGNLTIPNSVTNIESEAFSGCSGFTGVEFQSVPQIGGSYTFYNVKCTKAVVLSDDSYVYKESNPYFPTVASVTAPCNLDLTGSVVANHKNLTRTHNYTEESDADAYQASAASCSTDATYFFKCANCDEHNSETWTKAGSAIHTFAANDLTHDVCTVCNHGFLRYEADRLQDPYKAENLKDKGDNTLTIVSHTFDEDNNQGVMEFNAPLVTIGDGAFEGCRDFTKVTIPHTVSAIGQSAFGYINPDCKIILRSLPTLSRYDQTFYFINTVSEYDDAGNYIGDVNEQITITPAVELDDNSYVSPDFSGDASSFSYTRNIKNEWGTIVMPFDLMNCDDYDLYTLKDCSGSELTLKKTDYVAANTPALFRIKNGLVGDGKTHDITFNSTGSVNLYNHLISTQIVGTLTFTGSYSVKDITGMDGYIISNNNFWLIKTFEGSNVYCAPFRAYLTGNISGVKQLNINISEDADAMEALNAITSDDAEYYDLNGRRIPSLQRGVNIVKYGNGKTKKVTIK